MKKDLKQIMAFTLDKDVIVKLKKKRKQLKCKSHSKLVNDILRKALLDD